MQDTKSWWQSKTVWGAVMVVVAMAAQVFGYDVGDGAANADAIIAAVGAVIALYGRITAVHKIGAAPKAPLIMLAALGLGMAAHPVHAGTLVEAQAAEYKLNRANPSAMSDQKLGSRVIKQTVHIVNATYDFAVNGGAVGASNLKGEDGLDVVLPSGAVITGCIIDVITPGTTSASGTIALSTGQGAGDLKAALAAASYTGLVACVPVQTAATSIKLTADRTMTATIATGAITAGKFHVLVQYVVVE